MSCKVRVQYHVFSLGSYDKLITSISDCPRGYRKSVDQIADRLEIRFPHSAETESSLRECAEECNKYWKEYKSEYAVNPFERYNWAKDCHMFQFDDVKWFTEEEFKRWMGNSERSSLFEILPRKAPHTFCSMARFTKLEGKYVGKIGWHKACIRGIIVRYKYFNML